MKTTTDRDYTNISQSLHKKWSFSLRISSVNVAKSAVSLDDIVIQTVKQLLSYNYENPKKILVLTANVFSQFSKCNG